MYEHFHRFNCYCPFFFIALTEPETVYEMTTASNNLYIPSIFLYISCLKEKYVLFLPQSLLDSFVRGMEGISVLLWISLEHSDFFEITLAPICHRTYEFCLHSLSIHCYLIWKPYNICSYCHNSFFDVSETFLYLNWYFNSPPIVSNVSEPSLISGLQWILWTYVPAKLDMSDRHPTPDPSHLLFLQHIFNIYFKCPVVTFTLSMCLWMISWSYPMIYFQGFCYSHDFVGKFFSLICYWIHRTICIYHCQHDVTDIFSCFVCFSIDSATDHFEVICGSNIIFIPKSRTLEIYIPTRLQTSRHLYTVERWFTLIWRSITFTALVFFHIFSHTFHMPQYVVFTDFVMSYMMATIQFSSNTWIWSLAKKQVKTWKCQHTDISIWTGSIKLSLQLLLFWAFFKGSFSVFYYNENVNLVNLLI